MIIQQTINAIQNIKVPRFFNTERGFVNKFSHFLELEIENNNPFPENTIVEAEVQKRLNAHYGIRQRPDLLIHIPIETGLTENANENNFVVYAFKLKGVHSIVNEDFAKLDEMFEGLNYEVGIFINIGSYPNSFLENYNGNYKERIHEFSVNLSEEYNVEILHAYFNNNELIIENI